MSPRDILAELPPLATEVTSGTYNIAARPVRLADVTTAWTEAEHTDDRLVIVP